MTPGLHVLVLAAGASKRLGQPKQLVKLGGRPALHIVVSNAVAIAGHAVTIVVGAHAKEMTHLLAHSPASVIVNRHWEEGMGSSLRFGVAWEPQGGTDPYTRDPIDFVMLALGTGYNTNSLKFDAAFQYRWASWAGSATFEPVMPGQLPVAVGSRSTSQWRLKLSLILRMTDTDKLKRVAGKVFG